MSVAAAISRRYHVNNFVFIAREMFKQITGKQNSVERVNRQYLANANVNKTKHLISVESKNGKRRKIINMIVAVSAIVFI